jgi:hypothetical protein
MSEINFPPILKLCRKVIHRPQIQEKKQGEYGARPVASSSSIAAPLLYEKSPANPNLVDIPPYVEPSGIINSARSMGSPGQTNLKNNIASPTLLPYTIGMERE